MRLLMLTYPLTPVGPAACGGSEQIAYLLSRGLARQPGCQLRWIGARGSAGLAPGDSWEERLQAAGLGTLPEGEVTPERLARMQEQCNRAALRLLRDEGFDLVLNQGAFFHLAAAACELPVLFTLHLARRLYPAVALEQWASNLHWQCVSWTQAREYGERACCGVIRNGIDLRRFRPRQRPAAAGAPLLYLGRICPEKAPHLAIAIAQRLGRPLWIVGAVAPFPSHRAYFETAVAPALGPAMRWLPPPSARRKRALLREAAAVVIPSQIEETSSLLAMEAAACGVPVLALRAGALPEVVAHGETGWLADDAEGLIEAARRLGEISPAACRARAEAEFGAERMVADYAACCRRVAEGRHGPRPILQ